MSYEAKGREEKRREEQERRVSEERREQIKTVFEKRLEQKRSKRSNTRGRLFKRERKTIQLYLYK